ncbi:MAG: triose-phosphate isomerase, partial [Thermoplasmata archaeon]|nr:triose-phosphate isomerase [Thermoplasmata archaeon]
MTLRSPVVIVNFKTYPEACGERAMVLARICESVAQETGASIVIAPPMPDLSSLAAGLDIPVFSQHADDVKAGSTTGH